MVFVGVANYGGYAGECGDFMGSALGITSGDDDFGVWILPLDAADGGAGILIGGGGDGAGVQQNQVGLRGGSVSEAASFELALEGGAIGLGGAAAKVFDVVGGHGAYGSALLRFGFH